MLTTESIIIQGKIIDSDAFRPSDWAERLAGRLCTFINRRIFYSPMLKPGVYENYRCVFIDPQLLVKEPALFWEVINFAQTNRLTIINNTTIVLDEITYQ
ncbi:DUF3579 domain-containing protein [bacterium]|jgi:hypothetical protein|nr:DUF3579 domain-containing protein [bacterium]NBW57603.1 DUF3579 domain-containing protein [bacterium]NBX71761.1 DUF3579 domain-containing protein [bacterium]